MQNNIDHEFGMCYCDKMHIKRLKRRVGDKMVNVNKLKGKIVECGLSIEELAKRIGKDRATLYRRLNSNGKVQIASIATSVSWFCRMYFYVLLSFVF